jgi:galactosyl transferase GMA12/MNN10 family
MSHVVPYIQHRFTAHYESHRPWKPAPILQLNRECPRPDYRTVTDEIRDSNIGSSNLPKFDPHSICITTFTDEKKRSIWQMLYGWRSFHGVLDITWENKRNYASKHGYRLWDASDQVDARRPPGWSKIPAVRRLLQEENCTWVFFLDADTVIMDSKRKLEEFLPSDPTKHLVMAPDKTMKNGYNSGAWFIRNSDWSLALLDKWWSKTEHIKPVGLSKSGDQAGLNACLKTLQHNEFDQDGHAVAPRQCNFNSFTIMIDPRDYEENAVNIKDKEYYMSEFYYHKGDFIAHAAGVDNKEDTVKIFLEYAE